MLYYARNKQKREIIDTVMKYPKSTREEKTADCFSIFLEIARKA